MFLGRNVLKTCRNLVLVAQPLILHKWKVIDKFAFVIECTTYCSESCLGRIRSRESSDRKYLMFILHRWSGLDEKGAKRGPDEAVLKVGKIKKRRKEKRERKTFVYRTMKNKH